MRTGQDRKKLIIIVEFNLERGVPKNFSMTMRLKFLLKLPMTVLFCASTVRNRLQTFFFLNTNEDL